MDDETGLDGSDLVSVSSIKDINVKAFDLSGTEWGRFNLALQASSRLHLCVSCQWLTGLLCEKDSEDISGLPGTVPTWLTLTGAWGHTFSK